MTTLGFYFASLSYNEANKIRNQLNEIAANLGYTAQAGPTTGKGNASALLVAIAKGEIVCRLNRPLARKGFNNKLCRICGDGHYAKGLCSRHYHKFNKIKNNRKEMMKKTATEIAQEIMENGLATTQEELENQFEYFAREAGWSDEEIKAAIESPWFPRIKS